jgi:hypothetical protein
VPRPGGVASASWHIVPRREVGDHMPWELRKEVLLSVQSDEHDVEILQ